MSAQYKYVVFTEMPFSGFKTEPTHWGGPLPSKHQLKVTRMSADGGFYSPVLFERRPV